MVSAFAKDDALYPKDVRVRALVDQRLMFDLGTLYQKMTEYYVSSVVCYKIRLKFRRVN